jgi:hypothetical protein
MNVPQNVGASGLTRRAAFAGWNAPVSIVAAFLLAGAFFKARDPFPTMVVLRWLTGLSESGLTWMLGGLILAEGLAAAWLLSGRGASAAFIAVFLMLFGFSGVVIWLLVIGWDKPCGCGLPSSNEPSSLWMGLARNLGLIGLIAKAWFDNRIVIDYRRRSTARGSGHE